MNFTAYIQSAYACNQLTVRVGNRERGRRSRGEDAPAPSRSFPTEKDSKAQRSSDSNLSTFQAVGSRRTFWGEDWG